MPPKSSLYDTVDRVVDGTLAERLRQWRADGLSFADVSYELRSEFQVTVSHEAVRAWCISLGIHPSPEKNAS